MFLIVPFSFAGFAYLIVTLQVRHGFPPLYGKSDKALEEEIERLVPFAFALLLALLASAFYSPIFFLFGVLSFWCGLRVRRSVQERTERPLPWLLTPLTITVFNRWPMLAFDVWTLGTISLFGFLILISG